MSDNINNQNDVSNLSKQDLNLYSNFTSQHNPEIIQIPSPNLTPTKVYAKNNLGYLVLISSAKAIAVFLAGVILSSPYNIIE